MSTRDELGTTTFKHQRQKDWTGKFVRRLTMVFEIIQDDPEAETILVRDFVTNMVQETDREDFLSRFLTILDRS